VTAAAAGGRGAFDTTWRVRTCRMVGDDEEKTT
jgi:hypothetical protein